SPPPGFHASVPASVHIRRHQAEAGHLGPARVRSVGTPPSASRRGYDSSRRSARRACVGNRPPRPHWGALDAGFWVAPCDRCRRALRGLAVFLAALVGLRTADIDLPVFLALFASRRFWHVVDIEAGVGRVRIGGNTLPD